jgi:cysteine-rich repeat protein
VSVFSGNGDGTFLAATTVLAGAVPRSIQSWDFNGDHKLDLVVPNEGQYAGMPPGDVSILLGDGIGGFGAVSSFEADNGPTAVDVGDVNSDGRLDIVVANHFSDNVSVLLGLGDGTFVPPSNVSAGSQPRGVAIGDLDGDGRLDVVVATSGASGVSVLLQSDACAASCGNGFVESGEQCDDGNLSNGDCCSSTCQYEANGAPCASDGHPCNLDVCDATGTCTHNEAPAMGCLTSGKSIVLMKNSADDTKDKLLWKWIKGAELSQMDLADPISSTDYALCIYAGTTNTLIADAAIPPGSGWRTVGSKGYKFKGASPDGLSLALLKGGTAGKSKALAKGKGAALSDPALPLAYPVTVQLKKDGSSLCLESTFTADDEKKNDAAQFTAKK